MYTAPHTHAAPNSFSNCFQCSVYTAPHAHVTPNSCSTDHIPYFPKEPQYIGSLHTNSRRFTAQHLYDKRADNAASAESCATYVLPMLSVYSTTHTCSTKFLQQLFPMLSVYSATRTCNTKFLQHGSHTLLPKGSPVYRYPAY